MEAELIKRKKEKDKVLITLEKVDQALSSDFSVLWANKFELVFCYTHNIKNLNGTVNFNGFYLRELEQYSVFAEKQQN